MKLHPPILNLASVLMALGLSSTALVAQQAPAPVTAPANSPEAGSDTSQSNPAAFNSMQPSEPALTVRNQKVLESFEPPADEEYRLGAGDEIMLDYPGRPEFSAKHTIGPDGMITLNVAGSVHIADLTRDQASAAINKALAKYFIEPSVTVRVDKFTANRVRVIGFVQHPGEIPFEGTPTLLDAIGRAGLIVPVVAANGVTSNAGPSVPESCTIYRGNSMAVQVNLREMLLTGNALADMRLRRNDIVFVPEPKHLFVSVMGSVAKPGSVPITPESTLTSVLAEAGCCTEPGGYNPTIFILQKSTGKELKIPYKKILTTQGQTEYTIHPGDVIYVPVSGFNKVAGTIQKISPIATMLSFAAIAGMG